MNPEREAPFDEARYAEIVGKRAATYLPRFRRFARGEWLSWNWAAFFGTLAWLRYRRLYRWSWLYFFFSTPVLIIAALVPAATDRCGAALNPATPFIEYAFEALIAASWIVPALVADRLYFNEVRRFAAADKRPAPGRAMAIAATLVVQVLVFLTLFVSLTSGGYSQYRARVSQAILLASAARTAITEYAIEHRRMPERLDEITAAPSDPYVSKVELVDRATIRATFGERAARLAGHTVELVPAWKDDQIVSWTCTSNDLPNACLPANCRR